LFRPGTIEEQKDLIAELYREEGYVHPQVSIKTRQDPQDGNFILDVHIRKGPYYRVQEVNLIGNNAFDDHRLKRLMKTWKQANRPFVRNRFIPGRLTEDIARLTSFYREKGFADVLVTPKPRLDPKKNRVVVEVVIDEGPRYEVLFEGNDFFSDATLGKDLEFFEEGNRGNVGLRRSIQNIRRRYQESGFADGKVLWHEKDTAANGRRPIVIEIEEGDRYLVEEVRITGNSAIDNETIRKQVLTRPPSALHPGAYRPDVLQEDRTAVRALYLKHGYIHAGVDKHVEVDPEDKSVRVTIEIQEGVQTRISKIEIQGDIPPAASDLWQAIELEPGEPLQPFRIQEDEDNLAARIAALGYPYVQVTGKIDFSEDNRRARIIYQVDPGLYVQVGQIFFAGNFRTRRKVLARELGFETGDAFSLEEVLSAQRNLRNMDIFNSVQVKPIGLKERDSTVHLLFETLENKPYYLEIGGGYQTDKGFYGRTRIGDRNFMGSNKEIWTEGEYSQVGYRWDAGISNPRLLDTRISSEAGLFIEREELFNQDFGTDSVGANLTLLRPWGRFVTSSLTFQYELREQFLRGPNSTDVDPEALKERSILVTTPSILFDSRDSFIQPKEGWYAKFDVDISTGLENSLDNFLRYNLELRTYYTPISRLTLAARVFTGYLSAHGDNARLPQDQLFFLGGIVDVRGYKENLLRFDAAGSPVGGRLAAFSNLEARYDLGRNFELSTFVDAGLIKEALVDAGDDSLQWSVGLGLHYITPIGPVGLSYGLKIDPRPEEDAGQIHFSIGYTF
jgi:outer membrane protein insertion porin family